MTSRTPFSMAVAAAALVTLALPAAARAQAAGASAPAPAQARAAAPTGPAASGPAVTPPAPAATRTLTLAEALRTALALQPTVVQAQATTEAASARADEVRSGLLPQISATGSYTRATNNSAGGALVTTGGVVTAGSTGTSWSTTGAWRFGATLSQLIWDFGQTSGRWRAAEASASSQRQTEASTRLQVALGVQTAFFTARAGKDLMAVARDNLANQELHLRQVEGFVRAGTRSLIDLAQARTNRANAAVTLINAENSYATEKAQLNQAMGVEGPTDYEVANDVLPEVQGEAADLDTLLSEAIAHRPDIGALHEAVRAQELTQGAVRGGYWPTLGFTTAVTDSGPALDDMVSNWTGQLTLTWNLFQGGLTSAQAREAAANVTYARAAVDVERQAVRVEVEQARLAVRASREALGAATEALTNAREQLRLAEGRYATGVGNIIELSDAQVGLTTAAAQRVQAEYNLSTSRAQLQKALGRAPGAES